MYKFYDIFNETTDELFVNLWLLFIITRLLIFNNFMFKKEKIDFINITKVMIIYKRCRENEIHRSFH